MSGLEIAGVVLGVIPLFVSAIEHYEDGIRPFKTLKLAVYRQELSNYRTKLSLEYGLYTNTLEELLANIVPEDEASSMITQGYSPVWKQLDLEHKLKRRLGNAHTTYLMVMRQMQDVMAKIASLLDIEKQGNVHDSQDVCQKH